MPVLLGNMFVIPLGGKEKEYKDQNKLRVSYPFSTERAKQFPRNSHNQT